MTIVVEDVAIETLRVSVGRRPIKRRREDGTMWSEYRDVVVFHAATCWNAGYCQDPLPGHLAGVTAHGFGNLEARPLFRTCKTCKTNQVEDKIAAAAQRMAAANEQWLEWRVAQLKAQALIESAREARAQAEAAAVASWMNLHDDEITAVKAEARANWTKRNPERATLLDI